MVGWVSWGAILAGTWIIAFIIAEVIPFFSDLLALMSALFDSFFGFIFWGVAYFRMRKATYGPGAATKRGIRGMWGYVLNVIIILIGLFMLSAGTYVSHAFTLIVTSYKTDIARLLSTGSSWAIKLPRLVVLSLAQAMVCRKSL